MVIIGYYMIITENNFVKKRVSKTLYLQGSVTTSWGKSEVVGKCKGHEKYIRIEGPFVAQMVKNVPALQETWVWSPGLEDPLEKGMATPYSILAWRIPWTEEPGRLQPVGLQRVGHDWAAEHIEGRGGFRLGWSFHV